MIRQRALLLGVMLYVLLNLAITWGTGTLVYPEARWDGRKFVETGRMVTLCDRSCWVGF